MALKMSTGSVVSIVTTGTARELSSEDRPISSVLIQASPGNSGTIYVGDSTVTSTNGIALAASESLEVSGDSRPMGGLDELILSDIYINGTAGESVRVAIFKRRPNPQN